VSRRRDLEVIQLADEVTIGELVRLTGTRYSTLKYYTEQGLLEFGQAEQNLTRRYPRQAAIERLALIKRLKGNGRTIDQIKSYLEAYSESAGA